jgi:hypothetical protein
MPIQIDTYDPSPLLTKIRGILTKLGDNMLMDAVEMAGECGVKDGDALQKRLRREPGDVDAWRARSAAASHGWMWGTPKAIEKARKAGMVV